MIYSGVSRNWSIIFQYRGPIDLVLNKTFGVENLNKVIKMLLKDSNWKKKKRRDIRIIHWEDDLHLEYATLI
jgi:hypothetical protein